MIVKSLKNTSFDELLDCFLKAFENYFVPLPTDRNYYKQRWETAMVDYNFSYGMFDEDKLVGFIINAVDVRDGKKIAFNTGTGVLPDYRGKKIVKSIYEYALPLLRQNGFTTCSLEVITDNAIAIRSYQGIGFEICKNYKCYSGEIQLEAISPIQLNKVKLDAIDWQVLPNQESYSWDNQQETVKNSTYTCFQVIYNEEPESFFVMNTENGYVAQFDLLLDKGSWNRLFSGIKSISEKVKINNVDDRLIAKINALNSAGLKNTIDQYEMIMDIKT